jgi:hypothetical protein
VQATARGAENGGTSEIKDIAISFLKFSLVFKSPSGGFRGAE